MLDRYRWGQVNRISPEAPVPNVDIQKSESRPGGAANVALNLKAMGARVSIAGAIGDDADGDTLRHLLTENGFGTELLQEVKGRSTTTKTRVIGNRQQMLRIDQEQRDPIPTENSNALLNQIIGELDQIDVLIFEDYDKGVLQPELIQGLLKTCQQKGVPTVVDPKFRNFFAYQGATVFKPNFKELTDGMGKQIAKNDFSGIEALIGELQKRMPHENTLVTLSENGVLAVDQQGKSTHLPAHYRKITDVSGAGDTVIALTGLAIGAGLSLPAAATIANLGGGLVCEEVGVVPIDKERLMKELQSA